MVTQGKPASPEEGKSGTGKYEMKVSDLVWGKIKGYPWWPGQIYDSSDASKKALKAKRKEGPLLVAYFGDGTFAWCAPSQLIPFTEYFEEMSKQSVNTKFLNAVNTALNELARQAELKLGLGPSRPRAINAGVRAGVLVPEGEYERLGLPNREPSEMFEYVKRVAMGGLIASSLDLMVIKSWFLVFLRGTRGSDLSIEEARTVSGPKSVAKLMGDESNGRKRKRISEEDTSGKTGDETLENFRVGSIKMEIQKLTKIIKKCDGKVSSEEKERLESEMRSLMEMVTSLTVRT